MTVRVEEGLSLTPFRSLDSSLSVICVGRIVDAQDGLLDEERPLLEGRSARRRAEIISGRCLARRAMQLAGLPPAPVLCGEDRAPRWPAGLCGSLSHSRGLIAAGVSTSLEGLGIDLEQSGRLSDKAALRVLTADELDDVQRMPVHFASLATLIFSAKEAVYKAVYPIAGLYIGYREVTVSLDLDARSFTARYIGKHHVNNPLNAGRGHWWEIGETLLTRFEIGRET